MVLPRKAFLHSQSMMEPRKTCLSPISDHGIYSMPSSPKLNKTFNDQTQNFIFDELCDLQCWEDNLTVVEDEGYEDAGNYQAEFGGVCDPAVYFDTAGYLDDTVISQPVDLSTSQNMEIVWTGEFNRCFDKFNNPWCLIPTLEEPTNNYYESHWATYNDTAKVRFVCMDCANAWTSMKGRVSFWFRLNNNYKNQLCGEVYFKLFGQKCKDCNSQYFEHAVWYPEEVAKVLNNLSLEVGLRCYHMYDVDYVKINRMRYTRHGCPRQPHQPSQCLACQNGVCSNNMRRKLQHNNEGYARRVLGPIN